MHEIMLNDVFPVTKDYVSYLLTNRQAIKDIFREDQHIRVVAVFRSDHSNAIHDLAQFEEFRPQQK